MRIVLDGNVLVSSIPTSDAAPARIMDLWANRAFEVILSDHIFEGVDRAFRKPYWNRRYSDELIDSHLNFLWAEAILAIPVDTVRGVAEDLEDDLVLATAVAGRADFLVTGDRRQREVGEYGGVRIVTPREFLDLMEELLAVDPERSGLRGRDLSTTHPMLGSGTRTTVPRDSRLSGANAG